MRVLIVAWLLASTACASAQVKRSEQQAIQRADALVLQGCYSCLTDARDLYEGALGRRRPPALVQRLFEIDLLIALREKELALDATAAFARARALAAELPPALAAGRYIELAEAVFPDDIGTPRRERGRFVMEHRVLGERIAEERVWLDTGAISGPVRRYLSLALECSYKSTSRSGKPQAPPVAPDTSAGVPPLLQYRAAICVPVNREALERIRTEVPQFVDASFFLGRVAIQTIQQDGGRKARVLLQEAYSAFALSSAVTYLNGSLKQSAGDCRAALRFYDETLALEAVHEDAMLGRTVCLSFLRESDAAIAAATRVIDLDADNLGDGFYWRAWNRHQGGELPAARADSDRAKTLRYSSPILTLAGMIEHDQNDLAPAAADLTTAEELDAANCVARWYLALVALKREAWTPAATHFVNAMTCYRANALASEHNKEAMMAREDLDPEWKTAQLAGFDAAIKEDRSQESAAAYNAAVNFLRGGDRTSAVTYADLAARDPLRLPKVEELRKLFAPPAASQ